MESGQILCLQSCKHSLAIFSLKFNLTFLMASVSFQLKQRKCTISYIDLEYNVFKDVSKGRVFCDKRTFK